MSTQPASEALYREIAGAIDPIDPDEAAANPSFRAAVDAGYRAGREAAALRLSAEAVVVADAQPALADVFLSLAEEIWCLEVPDA